MSNRSEPINIAVFGPADHGKSTIIGFLFATHSPGFSIEEYVRSLRTQSWYKDDRKYACLLDIQSEERQGSIDSNAGRGTTRMLHYMEFRLGEQHFQFIDNPGHQSLERTYVRGIFQGQHGLFVVAANELQDHVQGLKQAMEDQSEDIKVPAAFTDLLIPLRIAVNFGMQSNTIAVSKMDLVGYSEEVFLSCRDVLAEYMENCLRVDPSSFDIIPTSVVARADRGENINSRPEHMAWWKGKTLEEALSCLKPPVTDTMLPLCIAVEDAKFDIPGQQTVLRGKIVSGTLKKGKVVKVAPLREPSSAVTVYARIRSIQLASESARPEIPYKASRRRVWAEFSEKSEYEAGSVISLSLSEMGAGRHLTKEGFKGFSDYQIITHREDMVQYGTVACIDIMAGSDLPRMRHGDQCELYLNGRKISGCRFLGMVSPAPLGQDSLKGKWICVALGTQIAVVVYDNKTVGSRAILGRSGMLYPGEIRRLGKAQRYHFVIATSLNMAFADLGVAEFETLTKNGYISEEDLKLPKPLRLEFGNREYKEMGRALRSLFRALDDLGVIVVSTVEVEPLMESTRRPKYDRGTLS